MPEGKTALFVIFVRRMNAERKHKVYYFEHRSFSQKSFNQGVLCRLFTRFTDRDLILSDQ